jgi:hypothetical protein
MQDGKGKKLMATKAKTKKIGEPEFVILDSGKFKGDYLNKEGRRYTKVQLQQRRPELFN